jgi:hypothetical protein
MYSSLNSRSSFSACCKTLLLAADKYACWPETFG